MTAPGFVLTVAGGGSLGFGLLLRVYCWPHRIQKEDYPLLRKTAVVGVLLICAGLIVGCGSDEAGVPVPVIDAAGEPAVMVDAGLDAGPEAAPDALMVDAPVMSMPDAAPDEPLTNPCAPCELWDGKTSCKSNCADSALCCCPYRNRCEAWLYPGKECCRK